jgi:hypothetical protein
VIVFYQCGVYPEPLKSTACIHGSTYFHTMENICSFVARLVERTIASFKNNVHLTFVKGSMFNTDWICVQYCGFSIKIWYVANYEGGNSAR